MSEILTKFEWTVLVGNICSLVCAVPFLFVAVLGGDSNILVFLAAVSLSIIFSWGLRYLNFSIIARVVSFVPVFYTLYLWDFNILAILDVIRHTIVR